MYRLLNRLPFSNGLVFWLPLYEGTGTTAHDKSLNSNDGTITGATWEKLNKYGCALNFDGESYVNFGNVKEINIPSLSCVVWFKPEISSIGVTQFLIQQGGTVSHFQSLATSIINSKPDEYIGNGIRGNRIYGTEIIKEGWVNFVSTREWNGINTTLKVYSNGILIDTLEVDWENSEDTVRDLILGAKSNLSSSYTGLIAEVTIWNRALSPTEITQLYNHQKRIMGF